MTMNRRNFLAAAGASALVWELRLAIADAQKVPATAPVPHMMEKTFGPLADSLAGVGAWKPYPKVEDRAGGWRCRRLCGWRWWSARMPR